MIFSSNPARALEPNQQPAQVVVVLHNIRSLHNVGAIFRTADAMGVEKIFLCGITPSPLDRFGNLRPQFAKVALGAEKYLAWQKVKSTTKSLDELKKDGYKLLAIEQSRKSTPYYKVRVGRVAKVVLILGSEIKGLPPSILKRADKILEIPMAGRVVRQAHHPRYTYRGKESLNVAVAFGIVAFGLRYG